MRADSDDFDAPPPPEGLGGSRWERARVIGAPRSPAATAATAAVDVARARFPFSIVWSPLPGITALLPCVGHMGITDSRGVIYDFAGPFSIAVDDFTFGRPYAYLPLDPALAAPAPGGAAKAPAERWDAGVDAACDAYARRVHNIVCDNCHHHTARALNEMGYGGRRDWGQVKLAAMVLLRGTWVSRRDALCVALFPVLLVAAIYALAALAR